MRRTMIVAALVLSVALSTTGIPGIQKTDAHTGYWRVDAGDGLNLRNGPGGTYARILTMPNGALVKAYGHRGNWLKLRYLATGDVGWAWLAFFVSASGNADTQGNASGLQTCFWNYWGQTVCAADWIAQAVASAAAAYGVGYWWLMSVAACESDFNPSAYNGSTGVSGLFQFLPSTFYAFGGSSLWSVWDQAYVAARMFASGLAYHWHCARLLGYA